MAHIKRSVAGRRRHKNVLKAAKGYRGRSKNCFRVAIEKVEKGMQYAYRDRKVKKRNFRGLWIQRINAAVREHGMVYSQFMNGLNKAGVTLDRKVLSDIAIHDTALFASLVKQSQDALKQSA